MIQISRFQLWSALIVVVLGLLFAGPNALDKSFVNELPSYVPRQQFNLGLDLRGGAYLLLEADMKQVVDENLKNLRDQTRNKLRGDRVQYQDLRSVSRGVTFRVEPAVLDKARDIADAIARDLGGGSGLFGGRSKS